MWHSLSAIVKPLSVVAGQVEVWLMISLCGHSSR